MNARTYAIIAAALVGPLPLSAGLADEPLPDPWSADPRDHQPGAQAPEFEVDPFWPKPLPNDWLVGQVGGIAVDRHDNIWILQRARTLTSDEAGALGQFEDATNDEDVPINALGQPRPSGPIADCCIPAPAVMKFDPEGNLLEAWGARPTRATSEATSAVKRTAASGRPASTASTSTTTTTCTSPATAMGPAAFLGPAPMAKTRTC